jgi:hypothetical protein
MDGYVTHIERRSMSRNPYCNSKNFFHHYNLSGHWEEKGWRLHLELHPRNHTTKRRLWRVKIVEYEEWPTSPIQEVEIFLAEIAGQGEIETTTKKIG